MNSLMTIGYEAADPADFDAALRQRDVDLLVDVRAVAGSRRRGFSKTALSERLAAQGISYVHLRDLGDPKPGRDAARAGRWGEFRSIYGKHIQSVAAQRALSELAQLMQNNRVALLCYEADAATCHRTIVAEQLANRTELVVVHLQVTQSEADRGVSARTHNHLGEGRAAP